MLLAFFSKSLKPSNDFGPVNVRDFGAIGNGVADDTAAIQAAVNFCYGSAVAPHGLANVHTNRPLYFPAGRYTISSPINLTLLVGGHIYGDGRMTTRITNTAGTGVFVTNGCARSVFERLTLAATGTTATVFDLSWDNSAGGNALQSNTFRDMDFSGGAKGLAIGAGGYMGSENLILNCFFSGCADVGLETLCFNALQNTVIGGNFGACGTGIRTPSGAVTVQSVGFQQSALWDINLTGTGAGDTINVTGCRSESVNFIRTGWTKTVTVSACNHKNALNGIFLYAENGVSIDTCVSLRGSVQIRGGDIRNCQFGRTDWITIFNPDVPVRTVNVSSTLAGGTMSAGTPTFGTYLARGVISYPSTYTAS